MRESQKDSPEVKPTDRIYQAALVGAVVAFHRRRVGLQQIELARFVGINQSAWSKLERGAVGLSLEYLTLIAPRFGRTPAGFLEDVERVRAALERQGVVVDLYRREGGTLPAQALVACVEAALAV